MARRGRLVTEVAALAVRWKLITWRRFDIAAVVVINASSSVSGRDVTAGRDLTVRSLVSLFTLVSSISFHSLVSESISDSHA